MQYILTREELDNLVPRSELVEANKALTAARDSILMHSGFRCIHDRNPLMPAERTYRNDYCDHCPISEIPNDATGFSVSRTICTLPRNYSK